MTNMKNRYMVSLKTLFLCIVGMFGWICLLSAQQTNSKLSSLSGKVQDKSGHSISGAQIRILNSDNSTITDESGFFEINIFEDNKSSLEISHIGFATKRIVLTGSKYFDVTLQRDVSNKDRIISTVYNKLPDYSTTSSFAIITGEQLNKTHNINIGAGLTGRLPGLTTRLTDASSGSENYSFNIRGIGTSNGTTPLVLIDGVVSGNLQNINPLEVESVTILKDAAATALYGMQGGNGIISVITKRGNNSGKPHVSINVENFVYQPIRTPDMVHSWEYASMRNEAYKNDGYGNNFVYSDAKIQNYLNGVNRNLYPDNNWYKTFVKPTVQAQRYNVSASGGSSTAKYYTNVSYLHVGGPFKVEQEKYNPSQSIDKVNIRTNVDVKLNNFVSSFMNISGSVARTNGSTSSNGSILRSVFNLPPTLYGPLTPSGQVITTPQETNPTYGMINQNGYQKQTTTIMTANLGLNVDLSFLVPGLSSRASATFDASANSIINGSTDYERWIRNESFPDSMAFIKQGTQLYKPLTITKNVTSKYSSNLDWLLNYKRKIKKYSIEGLAFARYQYNTLDEPLVYKRMTYGGRLNAGYNNIYFAEVAASYEGTEKFAPGHRYGLFPTASIAWVVSNQEFLKNNKVITNLKIKASSGLVGNDQLFGPRYLYLDYIRQVTARFISTLGGNIEEEQFGNPLLTWEKSRKSDISIELGLFNQFTFSADFFRENRSDILVVGNSIPATQGVPIGSLAPINIGQVLNQGFEIQLGYSKNFNKHFSISVQSYLDYNKNITKAGSEVKLGEDYAYRNRIVGYSVGQTWGYLVDRSNGSGYFNSQQEITNSGLRYEGRAPRPGDFIYRDLNGDKVIDAKDMAPIGNPGFPRISWGTNVNLNWKNFETDIQFQGIGENSQYYSDLGFFDYINGGTYFNIHRNAWTAERYANGTKISAPALSTTQSSSNQLNDFYVLNKQFIRLKNVEISYKIPVKLSKKLGTEFVKVYVSAQNLFTIDKLGNKDLDPEMGSISSFPTNRTWNVGLNVNF